MKRIINVMVLFIISAGVLAPVPWDYPEDDLEKHFFGKAEFIGDKYFFRGFDFEGYNPREGEYGLSFKIQSEAYSLGKTR